MRKLNCMTLQHKYRNENNNFTFMICWMLAVAFEITDSFSFDFTAHSICRQTNTATAHINDAMKFFEPLTESLFSHNFNATAQFDGINWKWRKLKTPQDLKNWLFWLYLREIYLMLTKMSTICFVFAFAGFPITKRYQRNEPAAAWISIWIQNVAKFTIRPNFQFECHIRYAARSRHFWS